MSQKQPIFVILPFVHWSTGEPVGGTNIEAEVVSVFTKTNLVPVECNDPERGDSWTIPPLSMLATVHEADFSGGQWFVLLEPLLYGPGSLGADIDAGKELLAAGWAETDVPYLPKDEVRARARELVRRELSR